MREFSDEEIKTIEYLIEEADTGEATDVFEFIKSYEERDERIYQKNIKLKLRQMPKKILKIFAKV